MEESWENHFKYELWVTELGNVEGADSLDNWKTYLL